MIKLKINYLLKLSICIMLMVPSGTDYADNKLCRQRGEKNIGDISNA